MKLKINSLCQKDTINIGLIIGSALKGGEIIYLSGDLACGKTTITKGIGQALGIKKNITSPTFTLIKGYSGRLPLWHMDFYRLNSGDEIINEVLELDNGINVLVIEWFDILDLNINDFILIEFKNIDETKREITISFNNDKYIYIYNQLKDKLKEGNLCIH